MKDTKNLDRVLALRSWAHGRERQTHHRIDQIGLSGKEIRQPKRLPEGYVSEVESKAVDRNIKRAIELRNRAKGRRLDVAEKLEAMAMELLEGRRKSDLHPALAKKLAREARRANR